MTVGKLLLRWLASFIAGTIGGGWVCGLAAVAGCVIYDEFLSGKNSRSR